MGCGCGSVVGAPGTPGTVGAPPVTALSPGVGYYVAAAAGYAGDGFDLVATATPAAAPLEREAFCWWCWFLLIGAVVTLGGDLK